jgi:hypothetical protein
LNRSTLPQPIWTLDSGSTFESAMITYLVSEKCIELCKKYLADPQANPLPLKVLREGPQEYSTNGSYSKNMRRHLKKHHTTVCKEEPTTNTLAANGETPTFVFEQNRSNRIFAQMFTAESLPLRFADSPWLKLWIASLPLSQAHTIPSRYIVTKNLLPTLRQQIQTTVSRSISDSHGFSITIDGWHSASNHKHLALTCHLIDSQWVLHNFTLDFVSFNGDRMTGEVVAQRVEDIWKAWDFPPECVMVNTTDNGGPERKATEDFLQVPWFHCAAHTSNLIIKKKASKLQRSYSCAMLLLSSAITFGILPTTLLSLRDHSLLALLQSRCQTLCPRAPNPAVIP